MTTTDGGAERRPKPNGAPGSVGLVARVKNIIVAPQREWDVIDAEPSTIGGIYARYVCILAAIPPLAKLIGTQAFGAGLPGIVTYRPPLIGSLVSAVVEYGMLLLAVYVLALVVDALAPHFDGTKDRLKAFKVAAYSYTAAMVAGVLMVLPPLGWLSFLLGLYSFYLLYLGLPKLMRAPQEKAVAFTIIVSVSVIVVMLVVAMIAGAVAATATGLANPARIGAVASGGTVSIGGHKVDVGKLEEASREMERAARRIQSGEASAVPVDDLKVLLPSAVAGFARTEVSTTSTGLGSGVEGKYVRGGSSIDLVVTDMAAAGAIAAMGSALGVAHTRETATGYEKVGKVGGRMTQEKYDRQARHGEYGVVVGDRFMVQATGSQVDMAQLKAAVNSVGLSRLEAMAKG